MFSPAFRRPFQNALANPDAAVITYLLYDTFTTALAAGAVNGTLSESPVATGGGIARTVTDANSKLSIASGLLTFATGGVGVGNPGLWYPLQSRTAGLVLICTNTPASAATDNVRFGFTGAQSGNADNGIAFTSAGALSAKVNGAAGVTVGIYTISTLYLCCVILRSVGVFLLVKGGLFTNWTLLWVGALGNTNQYPGNVAGGISGVFTADNLRIPDPAIAAQKYIVPTLAYDTFTRANGALGSTETTSPDGLTIAALTWNFTTGVWAIVSNAAVGTPGNGADVIVNGGFAADTNWTKGTGWSIAGGVGVATASSAAITEANGVVGTWYKATFTLAGFSAGTLALEFGDTATLGVAHAANATYTETRLCNTATAVGVLAAGSCTATIDDVSFLPLNLADLFSSVTVSTQDVIADVAVTSVASVATQSGLVLNLDSFTTPANFVIAYLDRDGPSCKLWKCVAGVYTQMISASITYVAGAQLRVIKNGTSYRFFYNQLAVGTVQTISDAGIISNLNHGKFSTDGRNTLDAFALWSTGSADNAHAILDGM